jgi:CheY-like chemotaxis protein
MSRSPVGVLAVSNDALRPVLLDRLLVDDSTCDVIVVESIARAYSRITQLQPAIVVLVIEIDDVDACQLLSMLQNDRALRGLRVLACAVSPECAAAHTLPAFEGPSENLAAAAS